MPAPCLKSPKKLSEPQSNMSLRLTRKTKSRGRERGRWLSPDPYYLLPTTYYLLPTTYYLLPTTCYLLPITYYLLPITYYLLPITFFSQQWGADFRKMPFRKEGSRKRDVESPRIPQTNTVAPGIPDLDVLAMAEVA